MRSVPDLKMYYVDTVPCSDPRFRVHLETTSPLGVFVGGQWQVAALRLQFLGHGADVIRFKATAATDVTNSELVRLTSVLVCIPASI